jgi:flagellar biosynthetic protein FliQ
LGADQALELMNLMLWNAFVVTAPILVAALVVGLLISVLQVATQLQEMTLTYVPKLLIAGLMLITLGSWMLGRITSFAIYTIKLIPSLS